MFTTEKKKVPIFRPGGTPSTALSRVPQFHTGVTPSVTKGKAGRGPENFDTAKKLRHAGKVSTILLYIQFIYYGYGLIFSSWVSIVRV